MKTVYGPVPSWRLGRSLGIDLLCKRGKVCSFDCLYCQLDRTAEKSLNRRVFVETSRVKEDFKEAIGKVKADIVTFSGTGEPTLAKNLGGAMSAIRNLTGLPLAVLTNSSLMRQSDVRRDLLGFDVVVAKLDAPNQILFEKINRPLAGMEFDTVVEGISRFRDEFDGKLALQMMFIEENKQYAKEMSELAARLSPDEVQIDTPLRASPVKPLSPSEISTIAREFGEFNVISVYEKEGPKVRPLDTGELHVRRPE